MQLIIKTVDISYGGQNAPIPHKDVCALIPGTCEYVLLHGKRDVTKFIKVNKGRVF